MGLFSSKKKVSVSSSSYNLAGDINDRINFLPTTIATKVLSHNEASMGETIQDALFHGTGMRYRGFARWARNQGYNAQLEMQSARINVGSNIDNDVLAASIIPGAGETVHIQTSEVGLADYGFWADKWMLENHPTEVDDSYEIDFNELTNTVSLTFTDGKIYTFTPAGFDPLAQYLYFSYVLTAGETPGEMEIGPEIIVASSANWPNMSTWTLVSNTSTPVELNAVDRKTTTVSYSDGRPNEVSVVENPHLVNSTDEVGYYTKREDHGLDLTGSKVTATLHYTSLIKTAKLVTTTTSASSEETLPGGVIKTTTVTDAVQSGGYGYSYREDEQDLLISSWSPMTAVIYQKGTGNAAFDAMFDVPASMGEFFPFVPIRLWNNFISEDYMPEQLPWNKKACKRVFDRKFDFLVEQLEASDSLGDIDFAYCVFGTALNTKENAARKYIFRFFQYVNTYGTSGDAEYQAWRVQWQAAANQQAKWVEWRDAQANPLDPLFGKPEPSRASYPATPYRQIQCRADKFNFNMSVMYTGIEETVFPGEYKPGVKQGEVQFTVASEETYKEYLISAGIVSDREFSGNTIFMRWQEKGQYRQLAVSGLWHNYMIYGGKGVDIHGPEALADPEESGFIIPLHEGVFRSMNLKDATQMGNAAAYMVLNCYQVTKQKWYQSTWFKIVLIVAVIVITIVTWGAGATAGAGVLGTAASVGTAIGLAGTAAIIAGAAINALAGMLIAQLIMQASVALLGPEVGAIVGAIAGVAMLSMGTSLATGGTAMQGLQNMTSAMNLLKGTIAGVNGYAQGVQGKIDDIADKIDQLQRDYKDKMTEVYTAWSENLGFNKATIDITALTESARVDYVYENLETFMQRTLMTGSDIANITNGLIGSFVEASTSNPLP